MKWDKKARERLRSREYQKKFFISYMGGITIAGIITMLFSKEGFSLNNFLHTFLPLVLGGFGVMVIMYFLSKDKRFTK